MKSQSEEAGIKGTHDCEVSDGWRATLLTGSEPWVGC